MPVLRLLASLLLACAGLVLTQTAAQAACTCQGRATVERQVRDADVVFSGVLVGTSRGTSGQDPATIYEVEAETLYKGDIPSGNVDVVSPRSKCDLDGLREEHAYVFFVTENRAELRADRCGGTSKANEERVAEVEDVLGAGTTVGGGEPSEPAPAEFTPVAGAEPDELTRLAAPGAALVLIGLLGLVVVGRATRRD